MKKIMIVDDEAVITTQLEEHLTSMGYDVVGEASSGEESITMARRFCPDLVLMDIIMPGTMDGIEAAAKIKSELDIPIIFVTAYGEDEHIERAKNINPYGYIMKPYSMNVIKASIEIALHRKDLELKQKQADKRIRRLYHTVEQNRYMILIMSVKGVIEYVNSRFIEKTGYTVTDVIGKDLLFLKSFEIPNGVYNEMWAKITSDGEWKKEFCSKKKNGEFFWESMAVSAVKNTKGDTVYYVVVKEDITEQRSMGEELLQSERMEALWIMTSGVAHEFNNILAIISGNIQLLRDRYGDHRELEDGFRPVRNAIDYGSEIVSKMVTFTRMKTDEPSYNFFDVGQLITQAVDSAIPGWKNTAQAKEVNYKTDKEGIEEVPKILCNCSELKEVFTNIINNAMDAMPGGGTLTVKARSVCATET